MSTEPTASKARRTPLVLWLLLATAGLALLLVGVSLFGPNPPIEIGKETTRITAPLAADGLPDYAAALLAKGRIGKDGQPITPERNGAVPFLRAMWPEPNSDEAIGEEDAEFLTAELGVECPPPGPRIEPLVTDTSKLAALRFLRNRLGDAGAGDSLTRDQLDAWREAFGADLESLSETDFFTSPESRASKDSRVLDFLWNCQPIDRPWSSEDIPFLAEWLQRNDRAIDLLAAGCERPEWYLPPPGLGSGDRGEIFAVTLHFVQTSRDAARMLTTRAMLRLGEGRVDLAAQDAEAIQRLSGHLRNGNFLVDHLVAAAIEQIGHAAVHRLCADGPVAASELRSIAALLDSVDSHAAWLRSLDTGERFSGLDLATAIAKGKSLSALDLDGGGADFVASTVKMNWNPVLRAHNGIIDEMLAAVKKPLWSQRQAALDALDRSLQARIGAVQSPGRLTAAAFSSTSRGEIAADVFLSLMSPAISAVFRVEDRVATNRQLTRVAVALALHRHEHGDYPDTLKALVPALLSKLPVDLFHNNPLVYRMTEDGYLLYALGANGQDDGGSCEEGQWGAAKFEGVEAEEPDAYYNDSEWDEVTGEYVGVAAPEDDSDHSYNKIPVGADDLSLRMPPLIKPWPWEIGAEVEGE